MSAFLGSIKADLLDRRIVPFVLLVGVCLLVAVGYLVLGGGGSSNPSTASTTPRISTGTSGIAVSQASASKAVAETTDGTAEQRKGEARNPFAPLPGAAKAETSKTISTPLTSTTSTSPGAGVTGSSPSSPSPSPSTGETTPAKETTPSKPSRPSTPAKPQSLYHVAVLFGEVPAETPAEGVQLTPYENLKLYTPLPSAQLALVAFRGVTADGKSATFTLVGEVILHGPATCLPSDSQCQAIELQASQSEQLEYITSGGTAVTYELRVVSIVKGTASSASAKSLLSEQSTPGRELLRREGLMTLPGLRYATDTGVLVFAGHPAFAASVARHKG
jgi:hypothetical protein